MKFLFSAALTCLSISSLSAFSYDIQSYQASEMIDLSADKFPTNGIFPDRGVVSKDGDIYVASSVTNEIWRITTDTEDGTVAAQKIIDGQVPPGVPVFTLGIDIDNENTIWNTNGLGLWRTRDGEASELVAANGVDGNFGHPEEVAVYGSGKVYFVDFTSGNLWLYDEDADTVALAADASAPGYEALQGLPPSPPAKPFSIGFTGIEVYKKHIYGVNFDKGTVVRMELLQDGSAGLPEVIATLPGFASGLDIDPRTKTLFASTAFSFTPNGPVPEGRVFALDLKDLNTPLEELPIPAELRGTFTDILVGFGVDDVNTKGVNRNIYLLDGSLEHIGVFGGDNLSDGRIVRLEPAQN
jgi:hypothetical protein